MGAFERSWREEVQKNYCARSFAHNSSAGAGYAPPAFESMADLFSLSIRRTSGNDGRSAMRAMSSGNSYHLRPHCTKRAASAMTCARASSEGPSRSDGAVVLLGAGLPPTFAGFDGGLLVGFAAVLAGMAGLRSVRATCAVPAGGGV